MIQNQSVKPNSLVYGELGFAMYSDVYRCVNRILVFVIGFWQAMFLAVCVVVGVAIGQYVDGNPTVVRFVRRFFGEGN